MASLSESVPQMFISFLHLHISSQAATYGYLLFITTVAIVILLRVVSRTLKPNLHLPPGPLCLPIFGNWLQVGNVLNHLLLTQLAERYGDIMLLRMGQRNLVVVSSPELAKEVLHTKGMEFGSRIRNVVFDLFSENGQDLIFAAYGHHWRKMRRILTLSFATNKVVRQCSAQWDEEICSFIHDLHEKPGSSTEGVVLRHRLQMLVYNTTYRILFDRRFDREDDPRYKELKNLNMERSMMAQSLSYNYGDFIPMLRPFLRGYLSRCKMVKEKRLRVLQSFIDDYKNDSIAPTIRNKKCAMDFILEAQRNGEINSANALYLVENVNAAGMDTIIWSIEWALAELVNHQEIQSKLRLEMETVLGKGTSLTAQDLPNMRLLHAVVKETLRLHTPVPLLVPHMNLQQSKLGGYDIPAESRIIVNTWWLSNNPKRWKLPEDFRPERFLEEETQVEVSGNDFNFLPFGVGRRSCPGVAVAVPIISLVVGRLVQAFQLLPPPGMKAVDIAGECGQFTLHIAKHSAIVCKPL
ncbi:hypothetical protein KP509_03G093500 [Ceratopteris richardii]|uniref:Cinnamate 4-hydroxylase n=1 Tax=Ceratopteris richardii TaxID=49495 RepID=A0A8T2V9C4_CERRI|nr:hypothetical protein KP509_03G093500 [Ceratopteris richardii]